MVIPKPYCVVQRSPLRHRRAGAVGFNLLTGRDLFFDASDVDVYYHVLNTIPPRVSEFTPDVPAELDQLIADCLAKDASKRPARVAEMLNTLRAIGTTWSREDAKPWWAGSETGAST